MLKRVFKLWIAFYILLHCEHVFFGISKYIERVNQKVVKNKIHEKKKSIKEKKRESQKQKANIKRKEKKVKRYITEKEHQD